VLLPLYYLGKVVGEERLKNWADKHGAWLAVSREDIEKSKAWFDKHGAKAVFLCRLVPGVRSLISLPAGMSQMNMPQFLIYSTLGNRHLGGVTGLPRLSPGRKLQRRDKYLGPVTYVVLGAIAAAFIWRVVKQKRAQKT
jgi:membrane protein DedA with SNARE-associated domain